MPKQSNSDRVTISRRATIEAIDEELRHAGNGMTRGQMADSLILRAHGALESRRAAGAYVNPIGPISSKVGAQA